jgi:hypothetical protein
VHRGLQSLGFCEEDSAGLFSRLGRKDDCAVLETFEVSLLVVKMARLFQKLWRY